MFRPLKLKISKWIVSIKLTNWWQHFAWCNTEFSPERRSTIPQEDHGDGNLRLHLCNELLKGVIQLFQVFYQRRLMTQAAERVDVEKLVHWNVDDGACCLGLFVIKPPALFSSTSPSPTGDTWILQKQRTENETLKLACIFFIIFFCKIRMGTSLVAQW